MIEYCEICEKEIDHDLVYPVLRSDGSLICEDCYDSLCEPGDVPF